MQLQYTVALAYLKHALYVGQRHWVRLVRSQDHLSSAHLQRVMLHLWLCRHGERKDRCDLPAEPVSLSKCLALAGCGVFH